MVTVVTIPPDTTGSPDPTSLEAWRALLRFHALATQRLDAELRDAHGVPIEWYDVLVQLSEHGGRMRMSALADAVLFSRTNCTRIIDRMERRSLVRRETDPNDHRGRVALLTGEGQRLLARAARTHLRGIDEVFASRLDDAETGAQAEVLGRLVAGLLDGESTEAR